MRDLAGADNFGGGGASGAGGRGHVSAGDRGSCIVLLLAVGLLVRSFVRLFLLLVSVESPSRWWSPSGIVRTAG